ncbi:DNA recombination protein RmuC [Microbacterium amylolyticum]|uniref:DNA recombination protein RmuC n=1 Tax=Microbacterium amylolyticum TaxID=936337 RepID=A0ABS4ZF79_9MICO|nr:DNA recombination protein RmuC [Microbacterium amylolyticum]MBP2435940.1 DNA recombination protein RmuC [Microbacterium amylolyticum]
MDPLSLILIVVALAVGVAVGWFARAARVTEGAAELAAARAEVAGLRDAFARQERLSQEAAERERAERAETAQRNSRESQILTALSPVQESLHRMQQRVDNMERERREQFGQVAEQLRSAQVIDEQLRQTTESLAGALRSNQARGVWGETQLRRIVEQAGLINRVDFDVQAAITSDAGAGRPDMLIHLPGHTSIAVDAKAPLDAFLDAMAIPETATGDDAARRGDLMKKHVKAVRSHIDALSKKSYWAGLNSSPEFVICFIPSESVLSAALSEDPGLLEYGFSKRVALASPVNLWAVLKTVAYSWTQQEVSEEAKSLFDLGTQLYDRLGSLAGHTDGMRRAIERTVDAYNGFVGSLESRVLVTARKFPGIDPSKLEQTASPATIDRPLRRTTAEELLPAPDDAVAAGTTPN